MEINEGKGECRLSFLAKESEIYEAIDAKEPVLLLMFKWANFSTNYICSSLSHTIIYVIKEFKDVFLDSGGLPP